MLQLLERLAVPADLLARRPEALPTLLDEVEEVGAALVVVTHDEGIA